MQNYNGQIAHLRDEIREAIRIILREHGLTQITLPDTLNYPTWVVWYDRHQIPHEGRVSGVQVDGIHMSLKVEDRETFECCDIDDDYALALRNLDWLDSIYENIQECLENDERN